MRRHRFYRPSPALVVALVALFVALGSGAYAAINLPANSVGTKQLKNGAVTNKKLRNNSVTSTKVKDYSLRAKDFKPGQLPAGTRGRLGTTGPQGPQGQQGAPGTPATAFTQYRPDSSMPYWLNVPDELASLSLPTAAKYLAFARLNITNSVDQPETVGCFLGYSPIGGPTHNGALGGTSDYAHITLSPGADQTITLLGPLQIPSDVADPPTTMYVKLVCARGGGTIGTSGTIDLDHVQLSAIQVGALNSQ
jgi:hypothetical protein